MKIFVFLCLAVALSGLTIHASAQSNAPVAVLSVQDKQHILHDKFAVSRTVAAIPDSVKQEYLLHTHATQMGMADADEPFHLPMY